MLLHANLILFMRDVWTREQGRAWWAGKGGALAASRRIGVTPNAFTLSRPVVERAG